MKTTIGILGNDYEITSKFVEKIILHTKASTDQEHIKMNIIINNYLLNKNKEEINDLITKIKESNIDYIVLTMNNKDIYKLIKENEIEIINKTFNINDNDLIKKIITLCGKEYI